MIRLEKSKWGDVIDLINDQACVVPLYGGQKLPGEEIYKSALVYY